MNANTPSLLGVLFRVGKRPNAMLRIMGVTAVAALGGIAQTSGREFPIGVTFSLRNPSQPARLEGANAPAPTNTSIAQNTNVIQIYQEAVNSTYLAQSDNTMSGVIALPLAEAQGDVINPRSMSFQIEQTLGIVAQDLNWTCINGQYANPGDPSVSPLKSRGIMTAITSNVVDISGTAANTVTAAIVRDAVDQTLQAVCTSNGFRPDEDWYAFTDTNMFKIMQRAYAVQTNAPADRHVAGLQIRYLNTAFGTLQLVLDPDMPANQLGIFNLADVGLVGLPVKDKGVLFNEAMAKSGSSDTEQIYGQLGLDHAQEQSHGKLILPAGVVIPA